MDTHARTQQLIAKYLEQALLPEEFAELQQLLVRDPCAADAFADATRVDAHLGQLFSRPATMPDPREWMTEPAPRNGAVGPVRARADYGSRPALKQSGPPAKRPARRTWIALAISAALAVASWWLPGPPEPAPDKTNPGLAQTPSEPRPNPVAAQDPEGFAEVTRMIGARLSRGDVPAAIGDRISRGAYQLASGLVQIRFDHGPEIILEAPCDFDLEHRDLMWLRRGKVSARVPHGSGNFTIETPSATVVDLGTEFGVQVDGASDSEVHVFDGKVEVVPRTDQESFPAVLLAKAASAIDRKTATPCGIDVDPERFLRNLNEPDSQYSRLILAWDPVLYYRMTPIGNTIQDRGPQRIDGLIVRGNPEGSPWAAGKIGSALQLRGPAYKDYAVIPDYPKTTNGTLSMAAWIYARSRPRSATIAKNWAGDEHGQFHFGLEYDRGALEIYISDKAGNEVSTRDETPLPIGRWHHVAFVADGTMLRLYRNGVEVSSTPYAGIGGDPALKVMGIGVKLNPTGSQPDILRFKDSNPGISDYWHGRIDEVALFNHPLTPEQISELYKSAE